MYNKKIYISLILRIFFLSNFLVAQVTRQALFIGNSYTYVNNLPQMVANVAASTGDMLIYDSYSPGGYTFQAHASDATTIAKIATGTWDFVVLQEQSQRPSFPLSQVQLEVFPYAQQLNTAIINSNPCAETVFYMTWGRKNGDASNCAAWPPICTYLGMDDLLRQRYMIMAQNYSAIVSPVGAVWRHIRQTNPAIELYNVDESHPSIAGTFAAACCFYTTLYRKDPTLITYTAGLSNVDAAVIKNAVKSIVYDNLSEWYITSYDPVSSFTFNEASTLQVNFTNASQNSDTYLWDFGNGTTSTTVSPNYTYPVAGNYTVSLTASKCGRSTTSSQTIHVGVLESSNHVDQAEQIKVYPNPTYDVINIEVPVFQNSMPFSLFTLDGKQVSFGTIASTHTTIDVTSLSKGFYILKIGTTKYNVLKLN